MRTLTPGNTPCYCIKLRRATNALTKFYDKILEPVNMTVSQFSLLNDIKLLNGCNKSELAQYAKLDRTTITRNLNVLLKKGLITDSPGNDNRNTLIQLTELGEATRTDGIDLWKQGQRQIKVAVGLDDKDFNRFMDFLAIIETIE